MIFRILIVLLLFCGLKGAVITPIEEPVYDENKALLGRDLFFDERLGSVNKQTGESKSCQYCHRLKGELSGTTNRLNSSDSLLNSAGNYFFGSSAGAKDFTLKEAIIHFFVHKDFYDTKPNYFIEQVLKNPNYVERFSKYYGSVNFANVIDAFEEFIISLRTPASFDRFLLGDEKAISKEAKEGYKTFVSLGCIACHSGANLGGGLMVYSKPEVGTKIKAKVPSLRNVMRTAPWMTINSYDLHDSIMYLRTLFIEVDVSKEQIDKMIKFFETLNSDTPRILLKK